MKSMSCNYLPRALAGLSLIIFSWSFDAIAKGHHSTPTLQMAWQVTGIDTPESVLEVNFKHQHYFLVSAIEGDFMTKDGQGSIVKIDTRGNIIDPTWVSGLNAPKGMATYKDKLYIADIDEVVEVSLNTGEILNRLAIPNAVFLNDVTADNKGNVFVSDTGTGQVFRINKKHIELYLENLPGANGLLIDKNRLLVGAGPDLIAFDAKRNPVVISNGFPYDIDGIAKADCKSYFVSAWYGQVYWVDATGQKTLLLDSVSEGIYTADITYSKQTKLLLVPNFFNNTVTSYKVID